MTNRIVVLAHTAIQVRLFVQKNRLHPKDILYASSPFKHDGINNCVVIYLDGWKHHPESAKINERIQFAKDIANLRILEMHDNDLILEKVIGSLVTFDIVMREFIELAYKRYFAVLAQQLFLKRIIK